MLTSEQFNIFINITWIKLCSDQPLGFEVKFGAKVLWITFKLMNSLH